MDAETLARLIRSRCSEEVGDAEFAAIKRGLAMADQDQDGADAVTQMTHP